MGDEWHDRWTSIHEAGHATVSRYFGFTVELATMGYVDLTWRSSVAPDDDDSIELLIVSAAGDAATTCLLNWTGTGEADNRRAVERLRKLGAGLWVTRRLMRDAREQAIHRVRALKPEIYAVADELRERRSLSQHQIDAVSVSARISLT